MTQTRTRSAGVDRPGLFSLAQIHYLLKVEFGRSLRYGHPILAMVVAVDGLDALRDRLGYEAKEAALGAAIDLLHRETRSFDYCGRLPDDRLLVVVPHVRPERADTLGKRLVRKSQDVNLDAVERGLGLSLSIGCGLLVSGVTLFYDELVAAAEGALAEAVAAGGGRCVVRPARGASPEL